MWEEHPEYQKQQMRLIGLGVAALVIIYIGFAVRQRDWDLLTQILMFVGAFVVAFGLVFGVVSTLMKIFTRKHADDTKIEDSHDA